MSDTAECLIAKGYPLQGVPSKSSWVESVKNENSDAYRPYFELVSLIGSGVVQLSSQDLGALQNECVGTLRSGGVNDYAFDASE